VYVRHLSLLDYRSWGAAEVGLGPGVNVLLGRNGVGKTNLAEAIGYLATQSSHRVAGDLPLVRRGAAQAVVRGAVVHEGRELLIEIEINPGKANRGRLNRAPVSRTRDLLGILRIVLFAPEDLAIVRGDPSERRRFLDELLVMRTPRFAGVKADYERALKQRNTLLKSAGAARRSGGPDLSVLEVWDEQLADFGAQLLAGRLSLVAALRPFTVAAYADVAPESEPADLQYRSSLGDVNPADDLRQAYLDEIAARRVAELERGISLVGPHRDELELRLGPGAAKGYASHGESWSLALALRLGSFGLLRRDGVDPVLILDDVFAELDSSRRASLAGWVAGADQVIVTAAVAADVPAALAGRQFVVKDDGVEPLDENGSA
jgi:DNA replication and repair protein RecF